MAQYIAVILIVLNAKIEVGMMMIIAIIKNWILLIQRVSKLLKFIVKTLSLKTRRKRGRMTDKEIKSDDLTLSELMYCAIQDLEDYIQCNNLETDKELGFILNELERIKETYDNR